jgi:hypothetical protein
MDGKRFDALSRSLAAGGTRRVILHFLGALPILGVLLSLVDDEQSDARRRRKPRRHRAVEQKARHDKQSERVEEQHKKNKHQHKRKKRKHRCKPRSDAWTCSGRCGQVPNNCGRMVDCGSCACGAACPVCQTCNPENGRCETRSDFIGQDCGLIGQVCQTDGVCVCDNTTCADGQRCNGMVCVCDATSCPTGCCDGERACRVNEDAACGTGGGQCTRCTGTGVTCGGGGTPGQCGCTSQGCGTQTCGTAVDNCGQTIPCTGCAGCCDDATCRNGNSRQACGQGGEVCHPCSGVCGVGGVCSSCDPIDAPCPAGLCCVDGACVASCPACQTCIDGACAGDSGQDRTTCQLPDDGGAGVCCNGSCCAGCCDAHAEHGTCSSCLAFVTSTSYTGNLGGLGGADDKCQTRAEAGGFKGTYQAWLSNASDSPASRFRCTAESCSTTGYTTVEGGLPITFNWQTLTEEDFVRAINITEFGSDSITSVWTNTQRNGTPSSGEFASCLNWTHGTGGTIEGRVGDSNSRFSTWTDSGSQICADLCALYCFQQS